MLRRNPTRLDLRQDDIDNIDKLREEYKRKQASQNTETIGKGKRKSVEMEEHGNEGSGTEEDAMISPEEQRQIQKQQAILEEGESANSTSTAKNRKKNTLPAQHTGS